MQVYVILTLAVLTYSFICFNGLTKNVPPRALKTVFLSAVFLLLLTCSAMRLSVGYDYNMYYNGFYNMGRAGFSTLVYKDWEWGFNIFTKVVFFFTRDYRIYMAIASAICLAGPFCLIFRHSKKAWLSVLLYVNLYFYYATMNFMRQSIAISLVAFAYTFLINKKLWAYTMVVLVAALFHTTVLIMLPVYFIVNFKPSLKIPLLYAYLIFWVFISSNETLDILTEFMHSEYRFSKYLSMGLSAVHVVIPSLVVLFGMFVVLKFIKPKNMLESDKLIVIQTNLMYFSYMWLTVMLRHALFERFSYYTYIFVILYIPELIEFVDDKYKKYANRRFNIKLRIYELSEEQQKDFIADFKKKRRALGIFITLFFVAATLVYHMYGLVVYDKGPHGIYPYRTWLNPNWM